MGCCQTSLNRIRNQSSFETKEILPLIRTWNLFKSNQPIKFTNDVLIRSESTRGQSRGDRVVSLSLSRSMHQSEVLRHFWTSKFVIDGNNYDFSQGDSCLRNEYKLVGGFTWIQCTFVHYLWSASLGNQRRKSSSQRDSNTSTSSNDLHSRSSITTRSSSCEFRIDVFASYFGL